MNSTQNKTSKNDEQSEKVHWTEWCAGAISGILIALLLGWLGYETYRYQPQEASFRLETTEITRVNDSYRVAFSVTNLSQASAAAVRVVGELDGQGGPEQAVTTFDYVASEATSRGALFFGTNPNEGSLKLSVTSYVQP
ncbi:TIGR02588 family protein [Ochrobactrum sp. BTU1]|jgi:uncharacterized protein (TIGR02588 family)|uniref:TIGR02588 family protein n=1 Tax=Ochrobactrum sp. BTU1 TaxID=2840456 RepID=UPI001C049757|nr:TIGR02588 family protein [Ochrobactrum sp. BTU1]